MTSYLSLDQTALAHFQDVDARYRLLHNDPENCTPMIIVNTPISNLPSWEERLADPLTMLRSELDILRPHLELRDDRVPTVRVQFGTAQIAAAFGCSICIPENSLPAASNHVLMNAEDVFHLPFPTLDVGWYGKLAEWTALWKTLLPAGIHIQHPDIQSAFNSAHLIRGNDILTDFYDQPDAVDALLDRVTDYMIAITKHTKAMISNDQEWFYDWGCLWKGAARISNCSMQMISPQLYRDHVLPRDIRFFNSVGGGRMHYCGITGDVINDFMTVPSITGLDFDSIRHDFFALCERAPDRITMTNAAAFTPDSDVMKRLLRGDWPKKRNIIITVKASSMADGKDILKKLRETMPC
jgi:hypothetical protein